MMYIFLNIYSERIYKLKFAMRYEATRRDLCEMCESYIELSLNDVNKVTRANCNLCH